MSLLRTTFADRSELPTPLRKLAIPHTRRAPISRGTLPAGGSVTIFSDTAGTPGVVTSIWTTLANSLVAKDTHLQVFVDGETRPSVDVDLGSLFLGHMGAFSARYQWSTTHMHGEGGVSNSLGGTLRFPIPYSTSCVIKYVNSTGTAVEMYSMVDYQTGVNVPFRLRSAGIPFNQARTLGVTDTDLMFSTPTGSPGWLVWLAYLGASKTPGNITYLERNISIAIDGETTPSIVSTGGEDFFLGSFYFQARTTYSQPDLAVSFHSQNAIPGQTQVGLDILERWGGYAFTSSLAATVTPKSYNTAAYAYGCLALFYTPSSSPWGQPFSTPAVPTSPALTAVTGGDTTLTAAVLPSTSPQGSAITGMTLTATPVGGGATKTAALAAGATSGTVTGLTNGAAYNVTVAATNAVGTSTASQLMAGYPAAALPSTGMLGWWRADSISGLGRGNSVTTWPDSSPSNSPFTVSSGLLPPVLVPEALNGLPAVYFNYDAGALGQSMSLASALTTAAGTYTVLLVGAVVGNGVSGVRFFSSNNGTFLAACSATTGGVIVNAGGTDSGNAGVVPIKTFELMSVVTGASANTWLNGAIGTTGSAGTNGPGSLNLGQRPGQAQYYQVAISELLVYSGALTNTDRWTIEAYLASKYGLGTPAQT